MNLHGALGTPHRANQPSTGKGLLKPPARFGASTLLVTLMLACSSGSSPATTTESPPDAELDGAALPEGAGAEADALDSSIDVPRDEQDPLLDGQAGDAPDAFDGPEYGECVTLDVSSCQSGWCSLTPSCFRMGSPPDEWGRNPEDEAQVEMWVTRFAVVRDHEVTRGEWLAAGFPLPQPSASDGGPEGACTDPDCPVTGVTWFEALFFANAVSPNVQCFELIGCSGEPGTGMVCDDVITKTASILDCYGGYRLLTSAEWEFAARARRLTAFYTGPITPAESGTGCTDDGALSEAGWYCGNSGDPPALHPVKLKKVNDWGYYDSLGNAAEWVSDNYEPNQGPGPMFDPGGTVKVEGMGQTRGGSASSTPAGCRAAAHQPLAKATRGPWVGFRLAYSTKPNQ